MKALSICVYVFALVNKPPSAEAHLHLIGRKAAAIHSNKFRLVANGRMDGRSRESINNLYFYIHAHANAQMADQK